MIFYYNGIKDNKGAKLQKCWYGTGRLINHPEGTITITGKHYADFSPSVYAAFAVENNTELQSDYFENDRIRVRPDHPLYLQVKAAADKQTARRAA